MDEKFLNYLRQKGRVTVAEAQKDFGIGYTDARKKFEEFEKAGIVEIQGPWFVCKPLEEGAGKTREKQENHTAKEHKSLFSDDGNAEEEEDLITKRMRIIEERRRTIAGSQGISSDDKKDSREEEGEGDNSVEDSLKQNMNAIEKAKADRINRFMKDVGPDADSDEEDELSKLISMFPDGEDDPEIPLFIRSVQEGANTTRSRLITELDMLFHIDDPEAPNLEEKRKTVIEELKDEESSALRTGTEEDSFFTGNRGHIISRIKDVCVKRNRYGDDLKLELRYPDETPYEISLVYDHFLTDNGKTFAYIAGKIDLTEPEAVAEIRSVASFYSVEIIDGVLYKSLEDLAKAMIELMRFAVAIDEISECSYEY